MLHVFTALIEHLKGIQKPIVFIPNPGNAGDILILHGALELFKSLSITFTFGEYDKFFEDKHVIYSGGGNLIGLYTNCKIFLENNHKKNDITLLPATIRNEDSLISSLKDNVHIFCRELISYAYVQNMRDSKNTYLAPDMALYIHDVDKFKNKKRKGIGIVFRTDYEKRTEETLPTENYDLSSELMKGVAALNPDGIKQIGESMLEYVSNFEKIKTDRLHVGIACHLTETPCDLYPNSYYKNKAIYEFSLKKDPNIRFISYSR